MENKIMKIMEGNLGYKEPFIVYRASCDCLDPDHDITLDLTYDDEYDQVYLEVFEKLNWTSYYGDCNWFSGILRKIKATFLIWFKGRIEVESSFIFGDEDQMIAFAGAIVKARNKLRDKRKSWEIIENLQGDKD